MTAKQRESYEAGLTGHIAGTEQQVTDALEAVVKDSAADEVLVTTSTYDRGALLDSFRRLARITGLTSADAWNDPSCAGVTTSRRPGRVPPLPRG